MSRVVTGILVPTMRLNKNDMCAQWQIQDFPNMGARTLIATPIFFRKLHGNEEILAGGHKGQSMHWYNLDRKLNEVKNCYVFISLLVITCFYYF